MKKLNHRGLQEDFYKIVANNLEVEQENSVTIVVYESRDPLSLYTYIYNTTEECDLDLSEIFKYRL